MSHPARDMVNKSLRRIHYIKLRDRYRYYAFYSTCQLLVAVLILLCPQWYGGGDDWRIYFGRGSVLFSMTLVVWIPSAVKLAFPDEDPPQL